MDIFKDEISLEAKKIQDRLDSGNSISVEDLKIIFLGLLKEEDANENKQP